MIDGTAVNVALPILQSSLHANVADTQWVVEAYAFFLAALILVGGSLGDVFGRKRIFGIGVTLFALASAGCGFSGNILQLILSRAVQGIGGALLVPGSLSIISANFSKEQRGRAIGTWSGFSVITGSLGPVLGGWLVEHLSWRAVFFLNIPLAIIVLIVLFWGVPESRDEQAGKLDWGGALLIVFGLGIIVYGLITSSDLGLNHPLVLGALVLGILVLIAFLFWEARVASPLVPLSLFRSPIFSGANLFTLLIYSAVGVFTFYFPFNLIKVQGYSASAAGAAMLPMILIVFVLSRWSGGLVNRYGAKLPLVVGPLITASGFAFLALPVAPGSYWTTFFPAIVLLGLGFATSTPTLTTTVMNAVEVRHTGLASGINNAVARTAALLSVAILSVVFMIIFTASLDSNLKENGIAPAIQRQVEAQATQLTAIQAPAGVSNTVRVAIEQTINNSFVTSFRSVMLFSMGLTLASALIAWVTIPKTVSENKNISRATPEVQAALK
jgi:EmrB/QacA subfamily drug resistance transporter